MSTNPITIFWFRRDLRLEDNAGLYHALKSGLPVLPLFIFDKNILSELNEKDLRVQFIWREVMEIKAKLENEFGSSILMKFGDPNEVYLQLLDEYSIKMVFTNKDYEPYAQQRDRAIYDTLKSKGVEFRGYKDQVIFEKSEVVKDDGKPYTVFTPYMRKFKDRLTDFHLKSYPNKKYSAHYYKTESLPELTLQEMDFIETSFEFPAKQVGSDLLKTYAETRDIPSVKGTSRLSLHLRFGTISIRELAKKAKAVNVKFFNELIWRDFYQMILFHFPHTVTASFRPKYDDINWENDETLFKKWCDGKTGYPLVDAGMRELNATGFMHNRVRMVVASFLTKHLLIDWRWGEAYFAAKLLDFDQASNIGGWQWAAGSGVDAAPYFRVFNPTLQLEKFDKSFKYVKRWVPEYETSQYPEPIVDHKFARERAIATYKKALA